MWQWVHTMRIEIRNITIDSAQNYLEIDKHVVHYLGNHTEAANVMSKTLT